MSLREDAREAAAVAYDNIGYVSSASHIRAEEFEAPGCCVRLAGVAAVLAEIDKYEEVEARMRPSEYKQGKFPLCANGDGVFVVTGSKTGSRAGYTQSVGHILVRKPEEPETVTLPRKTVAGLIKEAEQPSRTLEGEAVITEARSYVKP